ncbi:MAG: ABC-2 family transporter protein, partial [Patescibacteria group bacterium]
KTAEEINDGTFSKYLYMPITFPVFIFFRSLAERTIYFISAILEVTFFILIVKANLFIQINFIYLMYFIISLILAYFIYFVMSFSFNLLSFWSREAHGPIFLFTWISEFTSGEFYPLNILSPVFFSFLSILPFAYLLFYPIMIYFGKVSGYEIIKIMCLQLFWIALFSVLAAFIWKKGLRKYSGEGI